MNRASRTCIRPFEICAGSHTSIAAALNAGGMTPTIANGLPPIVSVRPTAAGARLKRRCQKPSLITAAPGPSGSSSSGRK